MGTNATGILVGPVLNSQPVKDICSESFQISFEAGLVCQVSFVYVIVTNHVNWHRENLQSDEE